MRLILHLITCALVLSTGTALAEPNYNVLVEAIGKQENSVRYPYGIKSIDTHGNKTYARKICLNTVRNNYARWIKAGKPKTYIEFLGDRYCPVLDDKPGHAVWAGNVARLYEKGVKNAIG